MQKFKEYVRDNFEKSYSTGWKVKTEFGVSTGGQKYACFVSSGVWYAVRLILEDYPYNDSVLLKTNHLTLAGVDAKIAEYRKILADIHNIHSMFVKEYLPRMVWRASKLLPKNWAERMDNYLERGDIIRCPLLTVLHHVGIYLGNGEVAHVSGSGGGKFEAKARKGKLISEFVDDDKSTIEVIVFLLRARTKEQIACTAENYVTNNFREGEYNVFWRNCQHFATLCALGYEFFLEGDYVNLEQ